jgi:hypothetical protein
MESSSPITILGAYERVFDETFKQRSDNHFNSLTYDNKCPVNPFDWSELKTSLLVNEIINDREHYTILSDFIKRMNLDLWQSLECRDEDMQNIFTEFVDKTGFNTLNLSKQPLSEKQLRKRELTRKKVEKLWEQYDVIFMKRKSLYKAGIVEAYRDLLKRVGSHYLNIDQLTTDEEKNIYEQHERLEKFNKQLTSINSKISKLQNEIDEMTQKTYLPTYDISQVKLLDGFEHKNDFFVQYEFTEYLTEHVRCRTFEAHNIYALRQKINELISFVRGSRHNRNNVDKKSKQVGITTVKFEKLNRKLPCNKRRLDEECVQSDIIPWTHPGKGQCHVPYTGGYGRFLKANANTMYGSNLCGISGSTQFITFAYLMSLMKYSVEELENRSNEEYEKSFNYLCQSACLILVGDGGHNITEVLYGIMFTLLLLWKLVNHCLLKNDFSIVLQWMQLEIDFKYIELYRTIFEKLRPFLRIVYSRTININFMHINKEYDMQELMIFQNKFQLEEQYFPIIFSPSNITDTGLAMFCLQCMFAFDSTLVDERVHYRYEIDDEENKANLQTLIQSIFSKDYNDLIDTDLERVKRECKVELKVESIPFAMKRNKLQIKHLG